MTFPVFIKGSRSRISIAKEVREVSRLRLQYEKSLQSGIMRLFSKIGRAAAEEYRETGDVVESIKPMQTELGQILYAHSTEVLTRFANRVFESRKLSFDSLINTFYSMEQAQKVVGITRTTRNLIHKAIVSAEKEGLGVDRTARLITERTSGAIGRSRASTIARTETHAAASYANHTAQELLRLPNQKKRWVSVGDARTRAHHASANGQEVGIDEKFVVRFKGQEILMNYPHDGSGGAANNINCRCLAVYFSDEDEIVADTRDTIKPETKPEIDIGHLIQSKGGSPTELQAALNDGLTALSARVAYKLPAPKVVVALRESSKKSHHNGNRHRIESNQQAIVHEYGHHVDRMIGKKEPFTPFGKTQANTMWSVQGLRAAWNEDRKASGLYRVSNDEKQIKLMQLRDELYVMKTVEETDEFGQTFRFTENGGEKFDGARNLSDVIDSFVSGLAYSSFSMHGHGTGYYGTRGRARGAAQREAFANMFAIMNKPKAKAWAEKNIPNLWAAFLAKLEELDSG